MIEPLRQMLKRVDADSTESESTHFRSLLLLGEMLYKIVVLSFVSAIKDDTSRSRYSIERGILREDGIGGWNVLDKVRDLNSLMYRDASDDFSEITTTRSKKGTWQYLAVQKMEETLAIVKSYEPKLKATACLMDWFRLFPELRNATKGHGAIPTQTEGSASEPLKESIDAILDNLHLFKREWSYMRRTQQGKYRVATLGKHSESFQYLKTARAKELEKIYSTGVYVFWSKPIRVSLIEVYADNSDELFLPNGKWDRNSYELICYTSGAVKRLETEEYEKPAQTLPPSETDPLGELSILGETFSNVPANREGYIRREQLEVELLDSLMQTDSRPIITLQGRGGIGKTWLTLEVIHRIAETQRFSGIIWFSARDVDLQEGGYRLVKPSLRTIGEMASEYCRLLDYDNSVSKPKNADRLAFLSQDMGSQTNIFGGPILFVIDNFETFEEPFADFAWIEQNIRNPNKVLITSRERFFKADYPIVVEGLEREEYYKLVDMISGRYGATITQQNRDELYSKTGGHPYVVKLVLAEMISSGTRSHQRILASRMDVLDVLFRKSYNRLYPEAKRVFLTLCKWTSWVPVSILSAAINSEGDHIDVQAAVDEIYRTSLIEKEESAEGVQMCFVPLTARVFGVAKIETSGLGMEVDRDSAVLQSFGVFQNAGYGDNMKPRLYQFLDSRADDFHDDGYGGKTGPILEDLLVSDPSLALTIYDYLVMRHRVSNATKPYLIELLKTYISASDNNDRRAYCWSEIIRMQHEMQYTRELIATIYSIGASRTLPFDLISECANILNKIRRDLSPEEIRAHDTARREILEAMDREISSAQADDFAKMAWLTLADRDTVRASKYVEAGLRIEPRNEHCLNARKRIAEQFG